MDSASQANDPLTIQIHPILKKYDPELFYLENIKQYGQSRSRNRLEFHTVMEIIEEIMPEQIKLRCHGLWSGTVAEFVHEFYKRSYFLKETSVYSGKNNKRNSDNIEFLFMRSS